MIRIIAVSIITISSLATNAQTIINYESEGNLEVTESAGCVEISQLNQSQTPADTFQGVRKCVDSENYKQAALLFFSTMSYGFYDIQRVSDKTAHQGLMVLRMQAVSGLSKDKVDRLQAELKALSRNSTEICSTLKQRGIPDYYPKYMVQHGMAAFDGEQPNKGLVKNFDSQSAWETALLKTAKCKKS